MLTVKINRTRSNTYTYSNTAPSPSPLNQVTLELSKDGQVWISRNVLDGMCIHILHILIHLRSRSLGPVSLPMSMMSQSGRLRISQVEIYLANIAGYVRLLHSSGMKARYEKKSAVRFISTTAWLYPGRELKEIKLHTEQYHTSCK